MNGIHAHQTNQKCVQIQSAKALTGLSQDKMKTLKQPQLVKRNRFEMAAHDLEVTFKKQRPSHPHTIDTYANPFKRKII